jgi:hypothetical protein
VTDEFGKNALFLARSTWNGLRTLYFQVHDPEVANEALQAILAEDPPARMWHFAMQHDPKWIKASQIFHQLARASGSVV